ncbi:MAG: hypothetical protein DWP94_04295 [Flavobacterium sp.]|nr:MAG: hypothetical protein DWP94_04295 [Flavobacterium sp.]
MGKLILKYISIIFITSTLLNGCDPFCSDTNVDEKDIEEIERINYGLDNSFELSIDKCLPKGYVILTTEKTNKIDTIQIKKIYIEVLRSNLRTRRMKIYENKRFLFEVYSVKNDKDSLQILFLSPDDI